MTNREFYIAVSSGITSAEIQQFATDAIAKMDERNAKRSSQPSKTQVLNAPILESMMALFTENPTTRYTENELGLALDITHNKAGALARQLVAEGKATSEEVKIPKVGKRKVYSLAVGE